MKQAWNKRYSSDTYIYGKQANVFFSAQLNILSPGNILFPCEGEGRNAVHAAGKGWNAYAFDQSEAGKKKALALAASADTTISYQVCDFFEYSPQIKFDCIALVYAHFPAEMRRKAHAKIIDWLIPGGWLVLEAFNKKQLKNNSGGPPVADMLYNSAELNNDFKDLNINLLTEQSIVLSEGSYHNGSADVIRMVAKKPA